MSPFNKISNSVYHMKMFRPFGASSGSPWEGKIAIVLQLFPPCNLESYLNGEKGQNPICLITVWLLANGDILAGGKG